MKKQKNDKTWAREGKNLKMEQGKLKEKKPKLNGPT
jgi:hypothetical protein